MSALKKLILLHIILPLVYSTEWTHSSWLDHNQKYHLKWRNDEKLGTITFLAEVKTRGWIGLGISPNGGMKNSDIVIGWIAEDGKPYFHDRFANGESLPTIDESQDWKLLESAQNQTHTILQFSRPYKTCDDSNDLEVTSDTTRLIYAFGDEDPKSINQIKIHQHFERGTKSALLINHESIYEPKEEDLEFTDFRVENMTIPAKDTTYWCKLFKVKFPVRRHAIKYLPEITAGNEDMTHHFTVFACSHPESHKLEQYLSISGIDCTESANMPPDFLHCLRPYFIWTVGGYPYITPPEAGIPFGADEDTTYFMMQSHYDNSDLVENRIDSSGLRIYHTSKLRPNEAFTFVAGYTVDYVSLIIPPKQPNFEVSSHCDMSCFDRFMPKDGIKVFAALPHAHLIGTKIKTRHFRGNEELPWIVNENNYDFNFQQFRVLRKAVHVMPGDVITTECTYNSSSRDFVTLGGEASKQEMCLTFLSYYPRMNNNSQTCMSGITESTVKAVSGVQEIMGFEPNHDPVIKRPQELQNMSLSKYLTERKEWNTDYQQLIKYSKQRAPCYWLKGPLDFELQHLVSYPENLKEYIPQKTKCQKLGSFEALSDNQNTNQINLFLLIAFTLTIILFS